MASRNYAAFLNLLPAFIQFAENIHGPGNGAKKASAVIGLAQNALLTAAAAGVVKQELATNINGIAAAVQDTFDAMTADGKLKTPVVPIAPEIPSSAPVLK